MIDCRPAGAFARADGTETPTDPARGFITRDNSVLLARHNFLM
jgi:hypothetical protein